MANPAPTIGLLGGGGRMGRMVATLLQGEFAGRAQLVAAPGKSSPMDALLAVDAVIDFSLPEGMSQLAKLALAREGRLPVFVVGSTGWKLDDRRILESLAARTPVLMSSNFSLGAQALTELLRQASPLLEALGYSPVIVETHHKHKKDAPSGTAVSLQRAIAPAGPGNVPTHSIRAGEIIGDHEVSFYGPADHLRFSHSAQDRSIFARGAIEAALWLAEKRPESQQLIPLEAYFRDRFSRKPQSP